MSIGAVGGRKRVVVVEYVEVAPSKEFFTMTRTFARSILALALAVAFVQTAAAQQKIDLRLRLAVGEAFRLRQSMAKTTTATIDNRAVTANENFTTGLVFKVEKVDPDGTLTLKVTYDQPSLAVSGSAVQGFEQLIQAVGRAVAGLHNQSFNVVLSPSGAVRGLEGNRECLQAAMRDLSGVPEPLRIIIEQALAQSVDEQVVREGMASIFHILPDGPKAIDERWSRQSGVSAQGVTETYEVFYKVLESKDGISQIKAYRQVKNSDVTSALGFRYSMSGVAEGMLYVEESTGVVKRGSFKLNLSGTATSGGKSAPVKSTATTTMERY